jgi:UDP-N-acetylglucosamine--N-acetylmuramyl-(pentapeptide) pyrophosphoryl-undecaprenol N-acetylglucosamine transferase
MTILLTGGGTGGHITPALSVARELKKLQPESKIVYVIERNSRFIELVKNEPAVDEIKTIFAGKWRRYNGDKLLDKLVDLKTMLFNLRDLVFLSIGFVQSVFIISEVKPAVVFVKGGFVGLPVGAAAALFKRPIVTHDSDTMPGIANRIVARWAAITATAFPAEFYSYPTSKIRWVGVPTADGFNLVGEEHKQALRREMDIPVKSKVILITGGSLGAVRLNTAVEQVVPKLLEEHPDLYVIHQTGSSSKDLYRGYSSERLSVHEFIKPLSNYSGAADIVIARPGATTMAELSVQAKTTIVVPNPLLAGGHQLTNAKYLVNHEAALEVEEGSGLTVGLADAIKKLINDPKEAHRLSKNIHELFKHDAAKTLSMLLLEQTKS